MHALNLKNELPQDFDSLINEVHYNDIAGKDVVLSTENKIKLDTDGFEEEVQISNLLLILALEPIPIFTVEGSNETQLVEDILLY